MPNKDFDKERQQPQAPPQQGAGAGRKNTEEVGEPVQLNEDMPQEQKGQAQKSGMGQQHPGGQHQAKPGGEQQGKPGGEHQGGQPQGGSHQGGGANR